MNEELICEELLLNNESPKELLTDKILINENKVQYISGLVFSGVLTLLPWLSFFFVPVKAALFISLTGVGGGLILLYHTRNTTQREMWLTMKGVFIPGYPEILWGDVLSIKIVRKTVDPIRTTTYTRMIRYDVKKRSYYFNIEDVGLSEQKLKSIVLSYWKLSKELENSKLGDNV